MEYGREIVLYPHPALRWKSKPLKRIDDELRQIVRRMFELMYEARGVGLAANQVALPYQLFVFNPSGDPERTEEEQVFVNPEIVHRKGTHEEEEGCLSLPEVFAPVRRAKKVQMVAFDLDGREVTLDTEGLPARVLQHEIDHLHGELFVDKLNPLVRPSVEEALERFEQRYQRSRERGEIEPDAEIVRKLGHLESLRT